MLRASIFSQARLPAFTYLPLTVLRASDFVAQHFLFHVALMPFTFGNLRIGAKLAAPLFAALAIASLFALLAVYRVRYRWLWLLPLAVGSEPFLYQSTIAYSLPVRMCENAVKTSIFLSRRGDRAADCAALEMLCGGQTSPGVRIPPSPLKPFIVVTQESH